MTSLKYTDKQFLSCFTVSKKEFLKEYRKLYGKGEARQLYNLALTTLMKVISVGDIKSFKKLNNFFEYISEVENRAMLKYYFENCDNPINHTNLIILACSYNKVEILKHIFCSSNILNKLSIDIGKHAIAPDDKDEMCHDSFYYAIRSGNVELLEVLISKWPSNYFAEHLEELDDILSSAYDDLKLKNVPLMKEMVLFVENKLLNLRFFSNMHEKSQGISDDINIITERIQLIVENINTLLTDYHVGTKKIDERFLYMAKFIAKSIHILKHLLKSTYDNIPWEEIEFCLISFVTSHIKQDENNLFNHTILYKSRMLNHLQNFGNKLKNYVLASADIFKLKDFPHLKREEVVEHIVANDPYFEELYFDYQHIKDIHSLQIMNKYIKLAVSIDFKEREGQLVMTRTLQVIGEHVKSTLESPNLSATTSQLLLLSLPKNIREYVTDLLNSLSHVYSFEKRSAIENMDIHFFNCVQNGIKNIGNIITNILFNKKIETIRILLKNIINSANLDEIKEFVSAFSYVDLDEFSPASFKTNEYERLAKLVEELDNAVSSKEYEENKIFEKINDIINVEKNRFKNVKIDYILEFASLKVLSIYSNDDKIGGSVIRDIKYNAYLSLEYLTPKIEPYSLKKIIELSLKFCNSVSSRLAIYHTFSCRNINFINQTVSLDSLVQPKATSVDNINRLFFEIFSFAQFAVGDVKWIQELKRKLSKKSYFILVHKQTTCTVKEEKYFYCLKVKLSELKSILSENACNAQTTECLSIYKKNKKLQAVVEVLVLDIMSILDILKCLEENILFLDYKVPLLTGKCLFNHLSCYNTLIDVLSDPFMAILLNAQKLSSEDIIQSKKKFRKCVMDNPSKLKYKQEQDLFTIANQEKIFVVLEEDNTEALKIWQKKGGDVKGRDIKLWTAWHLSAKRSSLKTARFCLDLTMKDIRGRNPLHIAAAYGNTSFVEFFINESQIFVNGVDNYGKTPLHVAAQNGHINAVELLLKNKADISSYDKNSLPPLYYAIRHGHINVVKFLLEKETNFNFNETFSGFISLHEAAGKGYLEMVTFLVQKGTTVNTKDDRDWTPLFAAIYNGHMDVIRYLISNGADVNIRIMGGATPLFFAVQNGNEEIVNILLTHGADTKVFNKALFSIPLHYTASDEYRRIVKSLPDNSNVMFEGVTPMHLAAESGHLNIVTLFLEHGINVDDRSKNNSTSLHFAAEGGHKSVVELLLEYKASVNAVDINGFSPLHVAALKGHQEIANILIKNKAKVNARAKGSVTALYAAALKGDSNTVDILIRNNANVNDKDDENRTPLYAAVENGHKDSVALLIKNNAEVNVKDNINFTTPLHMAAMMGHTEVIDILIKNNANINAIDKFGHTALHAAVEGDYKEIVKFLIANGSLLNIKKMNKIRLLSVAVNNNSKEIVEILIANGVIANFNAIFLAVFAGYSDIVRLFLKNKANISLKKSDCPLLHIAAERGYKEIVNDLIINWTVDVNSIICNITPLFLAAKEGHAEVVEILIANGANINAECYKGATPLHIAATFGCSSVVKVLLDNNADFKIVNESKVTPVQVAVFLHHLEVVKIMLQCKDINVNIKDKHGFTPLHVAAQNAYVGMVEYLIQEGADVHAKTVLTGDMPIHVAASCGHKNIVQFLISKGSNINDTNFKEQNVLYFALTKNQVDLVKYLIEEEAAAVNGIDAIGLTHLHNAAFFGYKDIVKVLLENGAVYNAADKKHKKQALEMTDHTDVIDVLLATEKLFKAVKNNNPLQTGLIIMAGGVVNAKNAETGTSLHYAAWKGYLDVVKILLQNKSNPNAVHNKGFTPLHYAAKFSHLEVLKVLLGNGAMHDVVSDTGKTPMNLAEDKNIIDLLNAVSEAFNNIKANNSKFIYDLKKVKDINTVKAVLNARNRENKTLVVVALLNNFSKVDQLKEMFQGDVTSKIDSAYGYFSADDNEKGLSILQSVFEKRKEIFGPDNPGTLDIQLQIGNILLQQGAYEEALNLFEEIFQKQKKMFGLNHKDTLDTRSAIALLQLEQGKPEALDFYKEHYSLQKKVLGPNHADTLKSQFHIAVILEEQGKYDEALYHYQEVYKIRKKLNYVSAILPQGNIPIILAKQGKLEEALKLHKDVLQQKRMYFGGNDEDTLRTSQHIAELLFRQRKYPDALKSYEELLSTQKKVLGLNHIDPLKTQYNMANVLFAQSKWIEALKAYKDNFRVKKSIWGPNDPAVLDSLRKIELINIRFKCDDNGESCVFQLLQKYINIAANNGDMPTMQYLLKNGVKVNNKDIDGRSPIHYACNNGYMNIVTYLLKNGADATQFTNKGNTPLHTAAFKSYKEIVQVLLQHVSENKLNDFINAKTTVGGNTPLHVAAKKGSICIVLSLLEYGAIYNIQNKEGFIPSDVSENQVVSDLLKLLKELFDDAKNGDIGITSRLKMVKLEHISAIVNARNNLDKTLLQVAIAQKHHIIASEVLRTLYMKLKKI